MNICALHPFSVFVVAHGPGYDICLFWATVETRLSAWERLNSNHIHPPWLLHTVEVSLGKILLGRPHGNAFLCKHVLADRPHGSCKRTFLKPGLRVKKTPPLRSCVDSESTYFACWWHHRPLNPRHLITTTTTTTDYMLVFVLQRILSSSGLLVLCSVSPSTVCLYTAHKLYAHAPALLLCFWWILSATYRPGIWTKVCWVVSNGSIWTQLLLKRCWGRKGGGEDRSGTCEPQIAPGGSFIGVWVNVNGYLSSWALHGSLNVCERLIPTSVVKHFERSVRPEKAFHKFSPFTNYHRISVFKCVYFHSVTRTLH